MKVISHRGNINGSNPELENNPKNIRSVLSQGFDVEIDLWFLEDKLYLGHDKPMFKINPEFVYNKGLWIHCKNVKAAEFILNYPKLIAFFHQNDEVSITTNGYLWTFHGGRITPKSIAVLPETYELWDTHDAFGVCTDYPLKYK